MRWPWAGKTAVNQVPKPVAEYLPPRPEPDVYDVTLQHYVIKTFNGNEYQVWADTVRHETGVGRAMTAFLETASYAWVSPSGYGSVLCEWKRSSSLRMLLEVRSSEIVSIESIGSKMREVQCR